MLVKTSVCLPLRSWAALQAASTGAANELELAIMCVKKAMKRDMRILKKHEYSTCRYNREAVADTKMYLFLSIRDYQAFKTYRFLMNCSLSYLICKAIDRYLPGVLRTLQQRRKTHNRMWVILWQSGLDRIFAGLHIKRSFGGPNVAGWRIVMTRSTGYIKVPRFRRK